jgi:hypothetical protein
MKASILRAATILLVAAAGTASLVAVAAGAPSKRTGKERLLIKGGMTGPIHVTATGPISGHGTVQIKTKGNVDHTTLRLPHGLVRMNVVEKSAVVHPNPSKCIATSIGHGTFKIIGGTGSFRGAIGHGTYVRHTTLVGARGPGGVCLGNSAPPASEQVSVTMTGTATVPQP